MSDVNVKANLENVRKRIREACIRAGRDESTVTLIAVSKTKPCELIMEAYEAGVRDFGENRVQELLEKEAKLPKDIRWHLIGHLQTNKVKQAVGKAYMIHSVDSYKLGEMISKESVKQGIITPILLEVNIAKEETKFGISPENALKSAYEIGGLPGIKLKGLMCVPPYVDVSEKNRTFFCALHNIIVDIKGKSVDNIEGSFIVECKLLSMGMSADFETAIEEGADFVRVGSSIFGERDYH